VFEKSGFMWNVECFQKVEEAIDGMGKAQWQKGCKFGNEIFGKSHI
jgi:hypothetical protein